MGSGLREIRARCFVFHFILQKWIFFATRLCFGLFFFATQVGAQGGANQSTPTASPVDVAKVVNDLVDLAYANHLKQESLREVEPVLALWNVDRESVDERIVNGKKILRGKIRLPSMARHSVPEIKESSFLITPGERVFVSFTIDTKRFCLLEDQFKARTQQSGWRGLIATSGVIPQGGKLLRMATRDGLQFFESFSYHILEGHCIDGFVIETMRRQR